MPRSLFNAPNLALALAFAVPALAQPAPAPPTHAGPFDPSRDAARDFEAAKTEARRTGRRILVDVGGNWCSWCRLLDRFYGEHKDLQALRDKHFVTLLVNYSPEQKNEALLGQFPKVKGYPHFFVLDATGKLLHSQDTGVLEDGKGYSREKMAAFLKAWKG
ncbi:MAG: thioredoxin family protein [Holophagaceae bacterium]|nr:thioredoxin family protein [Holophagaceae bacterium]